MALDDISARDFDLDRPDVSGLRVAEVSSSRALRALWATRLPRTKGLKKGLLALSSIDEIAHFVRDQRIDVLLLYNLAQSVLLGRVSCHIHFDLADDLAEMMQLEHPLLSRLGGRSKAMRSQDELVSRADSITVASSVLAARIARSALLLPNGADLAELENADGSAWRSRTGASTVGFVGAFEYWVDFDLVLAVAGQMPNWQFLLVGGGRRWHSVKQEVTARRLTNVHLTGAVPYSSAMDYAAAMDVCLLPFTHDAVSDGSCPLKLFEYAALRKPIVSTRTTEVASIGRGWVSFADDVSGSVQAIERFISDPQAAHRAGHLGRTLVEDRYNWPQLAAEFVEYLDRALKSVKA